MADCNLTYCTLSSIETTFTGVRNKPSQLNCFSKWNSGSEWKTLLNGFDKFVLTSFVKGQKVFPNIMVFDYTVSF